MDEKAHTQGKVVKAFSGKLPEDGGTLLSDFDKAPPPKFVECHLQPVPKTVTLCRFEVEGGGGFTAHETGPRFPYNWIDGEFVHERKLRLKNERKT